MQSRWVETAHLGPCLNASTPRASRLLKGTCPFSRGMKNEMILRGQRPQEIRGRKEKQSTSHPRVLLPSGCRADAHAAIIDSTKVQFLKSRDERTEEAPGHG